MSAFLHRLALDQIRDGERIDMVADEAERASVVERLGLLSLERLDAHVTLARDGDRIHANGRLRALLDQACVASGEAVAARIDEPFELSFAPAPAAPGGADEIELGQGDLDTVFYDGQAIDLGAAIEDSLALALNPYPRSANAEAALREAGVMSEEDASPFAVLAALKDKLGGGAS